MKKPFVLVFIFLMLLIFFSACEQGPKVLSISPCALKPAHSSDYGVGFAAYSNQFFWAIENGNVDAFAPVYLPHGATVKKFVAYYSDNSGAGKIIISLLRQNMETGQVETLAGVNSVQLPDSPERRVVEDTTINHAQIDNQTYSYHLNVNCWETVPELIFYGAKIIYE